MGQVKEVTMNVQYIMNVLSSHGEAKAIEALEFVLETLKAEPDTNVRDGATLIPVIECTNGMVDSKGKVLMYGDTFENVQQLKHILEPLDNHDQLALVTCDEHGDEVDRYPMAIDVIGNVRLIDDTIVREVQFIQRPNCPPDTRDKQPLVDRVIDCIEKDMIHGDVTVLDELLLKLPWEILKHVLPEEMWSDFNSIPSQCPFAIADFKAKYMQTHEEVCLALGYDPDDDGSNEMILGDGYFWLESEERWLEKTSSMYDEKEQEIADWLRE